MHIYGVQYFQNIEPPATSVGLTEMTSNTEKNNLGKKNKLPISKQSNKALLEYLKTMLTIRRFEEKAGQLYGMGIIGGFCHLYIGQEAVVTGIQAALKPGDTVITGYRCHGHMLAAGSPPKNVMAELTGKIDGVSSGKGGSMHMFIKGKFYGGHGIVGAQVPLGTGLAFANKYKKSNNVSITYFGDGAANQGQVFESFNMAALWKLPIVYVIENNQYAMGTSISRSTAIEELYSRGAAFGIPGKQVDGMDVIEVYKAAKKAVQNCRLGKGPILLELMTYRFRGHSMSDPAKYRTKEEVSKMRHERDPIEHIKTIILKNKILSEDKFKQLDKETREIISDAADFAQSSSEPLLSTLTSDVIL